MILPALSLALIAVAPSGHDAEPAADWLQLDSEIIALGTSLAVEDGGVSLSGHLIGSWDVSSDPFFAGASDKSGMSLRSTRVNVETTSGNYTGKMSMELSSGVGVLADAYVRTQCTETLGVTFGRFRERFLYGGFVDIEHNLLLDRGANGDNYDRRDNGLLLELNLGQWSLDASIQNGNDGVADEYLATARFEYAMLGTPFDDHQGAWGAAEGTNLGLAVAVADDGGLDNGYRQGFEVELSTGAVYMSGDVIQYDSEYDSSSGVPALNDIGAVLGMRKDDTNPWGFTFSYLWGDGDYELVLRREEFDDVNSTARQTVGAVWYVDGERGHDLKWTLQFVELDSGSSALDGKEISLGLTASFH